jgi:Ca-activated chloride channel family protein
VRDESGNPVRSQLDESGLRAIAQAAHGTYRPLGADGGGLDRLYAESLAPMAHLEKAAKLQRVYADWFALPLALSLFAIALDALLGWRPRARARSTRRGSGSNIIRASAVAAAALLALVPGRAHASVQSAEKAYRAGKFEDSAKQYDLERTKNPNDARIAVDAGAAAYRAGHFDAAEVSLSKALTLADPKLQERVLYDLGDARYRLGATTLKDAPEKTIERWKAAIGSYEGALKLTPNDTDAKFNRDFVKRKLAELENKQKNKPEDKPQQQDQKGKPGDKGDAGKSGTSNADQKGNASGKPEDGKQGKSPTPSQTGTDPGKAGAHSAQQNKPSGSPGANGQEQNSTGDKPGSDPRTSQGQNGKPSDQPGEDAAPGSLSARNARALLGSLRGEERHVRFGNSTPEHGDETPQKDW